MSTCCPPRLIVVASGKEDRHLSLEVDDSCWCDGGDASPTIDEHAEVALFTPSGKAVNGQTS